MTAAFRVGCGVDAHRFGGSGPLMLGTVEVPHDTGLVGHSDGDVAAHAVCDALLAAAGLADIGAHFPPGDPEWAGVSGQRLLRETVALIAGSGLRPVNAHVVVVCESPRVGPYREAMQLGMSAAVGAPVTVHATTTERMGFTGRGEGIACNAVALVEGAGE
ncbi:MAG: 2-C-methyl-D-erythritol 2,4-cyclodiphosphate synthase [Actinobacteria bacterium]|nr:2-C-methyl-D-erythritol 2,4-cyclodiphosphate synthase [Thermoleophilia bacterium]MCB9011743.1 2-C-methyl-D-erythritol 2,4-cyclodiphosphate synthase [Actinomycetota bacterium]